MANTPANAGSSEGQAARGTTGPRAVPGHRAAPPRAAPPRAAPPRAAQPRAAQPQSAQAAPPRTAESAEPTGLAWVPYLIVLAGVAAGVYTVFQGSKYAAQGTGLLGCALLVAGLARLVLPPRLAGLLSSRRKTSDVLAFTAFGAGVLVVALMLP
jgi:Protein of unknown function (DUF3017)